MKCGTWFSFFKVIKRYLSAVFWIRICVNVDPDLHPAFFPQCRPRCGSGSRDNNLYESRLVRLKSHKTDHKNIFKIGDQSKTERQEQPGLLVNFGQFPCSGLDPGKPTLCGSGPGPGSTTLPVRHSFKRKFGMKPIFYFSPRFEVHGEQMAFFSALTSTKLWQPF